MRPITDALTTGQWECRRAFVVGSGPSLEGFDFGRLKDELTIGCNEEYRWHPAVAICQDVRFFFGDGSPGRLPAKDNPAWYDGPHIPVFFKGHPDRPDPPCDNDKIYTIHAAQHDGKFVWGASLEEGLYYGANCGLAALNLAEILGASPIFLLGFDCCGRGGRANHHGLYPKDWDNQNADVYRMWIQDFWRCVPFVRASVVNLNPDGALDCFPEAWPDEVLAK